MKDKPEKQASPPNAEAASAGATDTQPERTAPEGQPAPPRSPRESETGVQSENTGERSQPSTSDPQEQPTPDAGHQPAANILHVKHLHVVLRPRFHVPHSDGTHAVGQRTILQDVNLTIKPGAFVALVGESGSGKSLLARALLGLLSPTRWEVSGAISFQDMPVLDPLTGQYVEQGLHRLRRRVAAVFQEPTSYLNPAVKIWRQLIERFSPDNIKLDLKAQDGLAGRFIALKLLRNSPARLEQSSDYLQRYAHQFSQGQQQRLLWSMALGNFDLIIADEPLASLDTTVQKEMVELITLHRAQGRIPSMLLITHDLRLVKALLTQPQDRIYFLGRKTEQAYTTVYTCGAHAFFNATDESIPPAIQSKLELARTYRFDKSQPAEPVGNSKDHLVISNLVQAYKHGAFQNARPVLKIDTLTVHKGEMLGIVGESGSGKSTLARAIVRLLNHTDKESKIVYQMSPDRTVDLVAVQPNGLSADSLVMKRLRAEIQIIFQDAATSFNPEMTVGEILQETVEMICTRKQRDVRQELALEIRQMCQALNLVEHEDELDSLWQHYPDELSAGQKQRLALMRVLLTHPKLLIADEPFTNVDRRTIYDMLKVIQTTRRKNGTTCLVISHDLSLVLEICDRIVVMNADAHGIGRIVQIGAPGEIRSSQDPYVRKLLDSILEI